MILYHLLEIPEPSCHSRMEIVRRMLLTGLMFHHLVYHHLIMAGGRIHSLVQVTFWLNARQVCGLCGMKLIFYRREYSGVKIILNIYSMLPKFIVDQTVWSVYQTVWSFGSHGLDRLDRWNPYQTRPIRPDQTGLIDRLVCWEHWQFGWD